MAGLLRQGHFLGTKLRSLRKRNGLTLEELSARCVQREAGAAPSGSYLSMIETGKRTPSPATLALLAGGFSQEEPWVLADGTALRARLEAPDTVLINRQLRAQEERLRYELAYFIGHRLLHNGDGLVSPREATWGLEAESAAGPAGVRGMGAQDVLYAWRDFECSFFAGALLCPRAPFRRFLVREAHRLASCLKLGVTSAVGMRRMTAVSPYRYWHYFDAYPPGFLRAVYRGNGIPLPWGNMSLVSDPCPRWAGFRLLRGAPLRKQPPHRPISQISVMHDGKRARLYCCHSVLTRDAARTLHVQSVGVDLLPALEAQGYDGDGIVASVSEACRRNGGDAPIPAVASPAHRSVAQVLNIHWIADALESPAGVICPRSGACPRTPRACGSARA